MEKNKEVEMYDNIVKNIVKKCGGYREKDIMKKPYIIRKTETWKYKKGLLMMIERKQLGKMSTAEVLKLALIKCYVIASCVFMFWTLVFLFGCFAYSL